MCAADLRCVGLFKDVLCCRPVDGTRGVPNFLDAKRLYRCRLIELKTPDVAMNPLSMDVDLMCPRFICLNQNGNEVELLLLERILEVVCYFVVGSSDGVILKLIASVAC